MPAEKQRSVVTAVAAGLVCAALVIVTLYAGRAPFFVLTLAAVLIAQAELYAVLKAGGQAPAAAVGLVCGGVLLVGTFLRGETALPFLVTLPLPLLMVWVLTVPKRKAASTLSSTYLGILYAPFLAAFCVLILRMPHGVVLTPAFIGMTAVFDSGGYLVGRKLGRHRMSRHISHKKSWEGFAAGMAVSLVLSAVILPFFEPFSVVLALKLAAVMSLLAPFGDLAESLIKRDLGVKDMGSIIPGHGGLFDRLDSILFNAPIAYLALRVVLG
jgi:phosphatidate cytidylyltransferase